MIMRLKIDKYMDDVRMVSKKNIPWEKMNGSSIMISGAAGMIGTFLIDVIMYKNNNEADFLCEVFALGRNEQKAVERFADYWESESFHFLKCDINAGIDSDKNLKTGSIGYVFHAASNTHPVAYSTDPISTITTNIIGTDNLLNFAAGHGCRRFVFASSNEIYGENRGDAELFDESYCGYIDSNTLRAGYPESKRCGEALCQAYLKQKELDVVIARFTRSYGPTVKLSDTKAITQFIKKAISGEDIVLKSKGDQFYSYTYVSDAVSGFLTVLLKGDCGEAYNIADIRSDITLKDLAEIVAGYAGKKVIMEIPDEIESAGYSKATKARLDSAKLQGLGWRADYDIASGIKRTMDILKLNLS